MKKEAIKSIVIVVLVIVLIIGGSYFVSEITVKEENYNSSMNGGVNQGTNQGSNQGGASNPQIDDDIPESEKKDHNIIGINDYLSLKSGSEVSIIYIARPTCGFCQKQDPILKNVAYLYNLDINYLNTDELSNSEHSKLMSSDDYFSGGYGTPLILLVKDDKIVADARGLRDKDALVSFFKENGIITE